MKKIANFCTFFRFCSFGNLEHIYWMDMFRHVDNRFVAEIIYLISILILLHVSLVNFPTLTKFSGCLSPVKKMAKIEADNFKPGGKSWAICFIHILHNQVFINWRAWCKNSLSDDFGPTFTEPPNYLLSCNVTVAKWIASCSQHIVLVIWIEFPPKLYRVTLLLARKVKLPKCQQIPIISAGGKKQICCCPW